MKNSSKLTYCPTASPVRFRSKSGANCATVTNVFTSSSFEPGGERLLRGGSSTLRAPADVGGFKLYQNSKHSPHHHALPRPRTPTRQAPGPKKGGARPCARRVWAGFRGGWRLTVLLGSFSKHKCTRVSQPLDVHMQFRAHTQYQYHPKLHTVHAHSTQPRDTTAQLMPTKPPPRPHRACIRAKRRCGRGDGALACSGVTTLHAPLRTHRAGAG